MKRRSQFARNQDVRSKKAKIDNEVQQEYEAIQSDSDDSPQKPPQQTPIKNSNLKQHQTTMQSTAAQTKLHFDSSGILNSPTRITRGKSAGLKISHASWIKAKSRWVQTTLENWRISTEELNTELLSLPFPFEQGIRKFGEEMKVELVDFSSLSQEAQLLSHVGDLTLQYDSWLNQFQPVLKQSLPNGIVSFLFHLLRNTKRLNSAQRTNRQQRMDIIRSQCFLDFWSDQQNFVGFVNASLKLRFLQSTAEDTVVPYFIRIGSFPSLVVVEDDTEDELIVQLFQIMRLLQMCLVERFGGLSENIPNLRLFGCSTYDTHMKLYSIGCRLRSDNQFEYIITPMGDFDMTIQDQALSFAVVLCRVFHASTELLSLPNAALHIPSSPRLIEPFTNAPRYNEFDPLQQEEEHQEEEQHQNQQEEDEEQQEQEKQEQDDCPDDQPVAPQLSLPDQLSPQMVPNAPNEDEEPISTPIRDGNHHQIPIEIPEELLNDGKDILKPNTILKFQPSGKHILIGDRFFPGGCNAGMYFGSRATTSVTRRVTSSASLIIKTASTRPAEDNGVPREISVLLAIPPHPNVVSMVDWCLLREGKSYALVMPRLHNELPKSGDDIAICSHDLIAALDHLHSHNIMHRDVKQTNVLYNPAAKSAILIDFDCAKVVIPGLPVSTDVGTRRYKAPEVVNGVAYDYNIDVWSSGVVIAEWILHEDVTNMDTGQPSGVPHQVRTSLLRRMREALQNLSRKEQELVCLATKMLTIAPQRRPSSNSLLPALQALVNPHQQRQQQNQAPQLQPRKQIAQPQQQQNLTTANTILTMGASHFRLTNGEESFPPSKSNHVEHPRIPLKDIHLNKQSLKDIHLNKQPQHQFVEQSTQPNQLHHTTTLTPRQNMATRRFQQHHQQPQTLNSDQNCNVM